MSWYNPQSWFAAPTAKKSPTGLTGLNGKAVAAPKTVDQHATQAITTGLMNGGLTLDPYQGYDTGGGLYYSGGSSSATGGGGAADTTDPAIALRTDASNRINSILSAYDSLFGGVDNTVKDKTNQLNQGYDEQTANLNKNYETTQGQTGSAYAARGLGQSSFLGDALGQNTDVYNQNNQQLVNDRNNSLGDLGRYAATTKAGLQSGRDQYGSMQGQLGNYDANALTSLIPQLQAAYGGLQQQQAGFGTNSDFINGLNKITPVQNHGADQLSSRLQQIVGSGIPKFAKNALSQGLIKQAQLTDPSQQSYWNDYYNQLLNG